MTSEKILLKVDKPQMNHNGGTIAFGPDGYLYVPLGDGGGADDVGLGHALMEMARTQQPSRARYFASM